MKSHFKAFTIIEVLVGLWIITVAILGPLAVAINSSSSSRNSKDTIVSAYLAQESFELMRFLRDTMFLRCITADASCVSTTIPPLGIENEQSSETAWRLFKNILSNGGGADSCFVVENPDGCTYDQEGILSNARINPVLDPDIYSATAADCEYLYHDNRRQLGATTTSSTDGMYLCDSQGGLLSATEFKRVVKVTSIPSIVPNIPGSYDELYNDDLRIEVTVSYSKSNMLTKRVKAIDFIRARQ